MNTSSSNNQEEDYDSARIAEVAAATLKASIKQTGGLTEFARQNNWPGFSDSDRRIISDVVGRYRENKQRVVQKIGELTSSVSELAMNALLGAQSNTLVEVKNEGELTEKDFVAVFESMLDGHFEITAKVLDMFGTGVEGMRGARGLAAGSK